MALTQVGMAPVAWFTLEGGCFALDECFHQG